jgi:hypothetical protein
MRRRFERILTPTRNDERVWGGAAYEEKHTIPFFVLSSFFTRVSSVLERKGRSCRTFCMSIQSDLRFFSSRARKVPRWLVVGKSKSCERAAKVVLEDGR